MITDKKFYLKIERWQFGFKVTDEEGILSHSVGCIWNVPGAPYQSIDFCTNLAGVKYTLLSGLIYIPGECAPMSGYAEQEDSGITTKIWWHLI